VIGGEGLALGVLTGLVVGATLFWPDILAAYKSWRKRSKP